MRGLDTCPQRSDWQSMRNFTCGARKADSRTWSSFSGRKSNVFASETFPSAHENFSSLAFYWVWIRSESHHHNLRSTFARPLLIVRFSYDSMKRKRTTQKLLSLAPS